MDRLRVGSRVEVSEMNTLGGTYRDQTGTVIALDEESILVEFDKYVGGHSGTYTWAMGKNGHCWWVDHIGTTTLPMKYVKHYPSMLSHVVGAH